MVAPSVNFLGILVSIQNTYEISAKQFNKSSYGYL